MNVKQRSFNITGKTLCVIAFSLLTWVLTCNAQSPTNPLSKNDVLDLLNHGVTSQRIAVLAHENRISFQVDANTEAELFRAGATPELIEDLRRLAPLPPTILVVHSNPGGAKVYIDDEPIGTTSEAGRLKLSTIVPGKHQIRFSLDGYHDAYRNTDLPQGVETDVDVILESTKPVVPENTPSSTSNNAGQKANVSPQPTPAKGPATVYFYRPDHFNHSIIPAQIFCDGISLGKIPNGHYFSVTLPAGKHVCNSTYNKTRVEMDLPGGGSYYIRVSMITGIPVRGSVSAVPEATAAATLKTLLPCGTSTGPDGSQVSGCGQ